MTDPQTLRTETAGLVRSEPEESMAHRAKKARLSVLLGKYEAETEVERKEELAERIWSLVHRIRSGDFGFSAQGAIAAVFAITILLVALLWHFRPATRLYSYPDDYLRVIQNVEPCEADGTCGHRRVMQEVVNGIPQLPVEMNFCQKPRFEAGHILQWIRTARRGSCTEIDGFDVVRGPDRLPVLAANCKPDYTLAPIAGHIACEGGSAKF